jgi:PEP-CTERM motif
MVPGPYNSSGLARNVSLSFLATSATATLTFTGRGFGNQGAVIDNIVVFTQDAPNNPPTGGVPVPGILGLLALGLAGLAYRRR